MSRNKYESGDEIYDEQGVEYDEELEEDDTQYNDEDDYDSYPKQEEFAHPIKQPVWRRICLGNTILQVSDTGIIKPNNDLFNSTNGFAYIGTPYRTYTVQLEPGVNKEYFVHDLVWRAFHGDPPSGWEVRHTHSEASKRRKYYSNALSCLTITPVTVELRPTLFEHI